MTYEERAFAVVAESLGKENRPGETTAAFVKNIAAALRAEREGASRRLSFRLMGQ
jgi:hypothetical protein